MCVCVLGCCVLFGLKSLSLFVVLFFVDRYVLFCKKTIFRTKKLLQVDPQAIIPETLHANGAKKFSKKKSQRSLRFSLYMYPNIYKYTLGYA